MIPIYIPTRGRAGCVTTLAALTEELRADAHLVVRRDEYNSYINNYPNTSIKVLPPRIEGLSATRQWILENCRSRGEGFQCQLDDDITCFNTKDDLTTWSMRSSTNDDILLAFAGMIGWLIEGKAMASMTDRVSSARPQKSDWYENGRVSQVFLYNVNMIRNIKARFDRVPIMADLDMTLQILEAGYNNRVWTRYSFSHKKEDSPGGCALYRTDEMKLEVAQKMSELHPGVVTWATKHKYNREYVYTTTSWRKFRR